MTNPYRILVTGSRDWPHLRTVYGALDIAATEAMANGHDRIVVVHGACPTGADVHAHMWATKCGATRPVTQEPHRAQDFGPWPRCGPIRNRHMVGLGADLCLAFVGPCTSSRCRRSEPHPSHGASGCASLAEAAGITVRRWPA